MGRGRDMNKKLILLTGATGRIGPHVHELLIKNGYSLRIATPDEPAKLENTEWVKTDFTLSNVDYQSLVKDVQIVVHMAAELHNPAAMEAVNVTASEALAKASEALGVRLFIYSSSVGVYGHPEQRIINEDTPTLSLDVDTRATFLDHPFLYDYCISKLKGEVVIARSLRRTKCVMLRFSNVVTEVQIRNVITWPMSTRIWRGGRNTHQIYVKDVAAGVDFFVSKYQNFTPGSEEQSEIYILSNDNEPANTYGKFFWRLAKERGKFFFLECPFWLPRWVDRAKDRLKFKRWTIGYPAGSAIYSPNKLMRLGYNHPVGILAIQAKVISEALKQ